MAKNQNLNQALKAKQDEFYTQLTDIEHELKHYKEFFRGKTVFCNCDDPYESSFLQYFLMNFNEKALGLKKLITTSYNGSPIMGTQLTIPFENEFKPAYKAVITELKDWNGDGKTGILDYKYAVENGIIPPPEILEGSGDFRSDECKKLLKEADIVVTNPPFSLFREYVAQLIEYDKKFLIIGNQNAITYKEIFPLFMQNKIWLGYGFRGNVGFFKSQYQDIAKSSQHREGMIRISGIMWFTNLDVKKRHENIFLYRNYTSEEFPKYDNYDAIEISKTSEIPCDYFGVMGVPITFMDKYNPEQFEIIGMAKRGAGDPALRTKVYTKEEYPNYSDLNAGPVLNINGVLKNTYPRILIKRKEENSNNGV